jgi:hypothetical protein
MKRKVHTESEMVKANSGHPTTLRASDLAKVLTRNLYNLNYFFPLHRGQKRYLQKDDTINAIHNWSDRKTKLFKNEYIQIAYDHLDTFYNNSEELF